MFQLFFVTLQLNKIETFKFLNAMPLKILLTCIESKKKITFKQKYDFLAKGIYRPWMYGYIQNFQKAIFNSKRLGVDVSHEHIEFKRVEFGEKEILFYNIYFYCPVIG